MEKRNMRAERFGIEAPAAPAPTAAAAAEEMELGAHLNHLSHLFVHIVVLCSVY